MSDEILVPCDVEGCSLRFKVAYDMYRHMYSFHKYPVRCPFKSCDGFYRPQQLENHIKDVHMMIRYRCLRCNALMKRTNLAKHTEACLNQGERKFVCPEPECGRKFLTSTTLAFHKRDVHVERVTCPMEGCGRSIKPHSLKNHLRLVHERPLAACQYCGKVLTRNSISRHSKICSFGPNGEKFRCTVPGCNQVFITSQRRSNHVFYHHKKSVQCPRPGCKSMVRPARLGLHIREIHDGERGQCDICKRTMLKQLLRTHVHRCAARGGPLRRARPGPEQKGECDRCKRVMLKNWLRIHVHRCGQPREKGECDHCKKFMPKNILARHVHSCEAQPSVVQRKMGKCHGCDKSMALTVLRRHVLSCVVEKRSVMGELLGTKVNRPGPKSSKLKILASQTEVKENYKPGPKSSKVNVRENFYRPGPKSSKVCLDAGERGENYRPGPKSSKVNLRREAEDEEKVERYDIYDSRPGPKSSKMRNLRVVRADSDDSMDGSGFTMGRTGRKTQHYDV